MPDLTLQDLYDDGLPAYTLEYWIARGLVHPMVRGRGTPREWPAEELQVANLMRRLVDVGFTVEGAAQVARTHLQREGMPLIPLGPGLVLAIDLLAEAGERCG